MHKKVIHHQQHAFAGHFFNQPTFCAVDHKFLWGVFGEQGYLCQVELSSGYIICLMSVCMQNCHMAVHKKCHVLVLAQCVGVRASAQLTSKLPLQLAIRHSFEK